MLNHAEGVGKVVEQNVSVHDKLPLVNEVSFYGNSLQLNKEGIHAVDRSHDEIFINQEKRKTFTAAPETWKSRAISFISDSIDRALSRDDINMC